LDVHLYACRRQSRHISDAYPGTADKLCQFIRHLSQTKQLLPADFWSDALTGGCIAGSRVYFHINHRGDVEPCTFCHFATHNINNCTLPEALASAFFTEISKGQPFNYNTLRPCPMIDHPGEMWKVIQKNEPKLPTKERRKCLPHLPPIFRDMLVAYKMSWKKSGRRMVIQGGL
jgi:hypothetical protein